VQKHPDLPLEIYNYTPAAQYNRAWTPVTTQCRGLIVDKLGNIVARPFPKFFNYGEYDHDFPARPPVVSEKMDGSLGIIYTYGGVTAVATRGSFSSEQAIWATEHLLGTYPDLAQPSGVTTLVEIIYPENRIVVDYGDAEGLWLLGVIDNTTGADFPLDRIDWWTGPRTTVFPYSLEKAVEGARGDAFADGEGVVLCWPRQDGPSLRIKVKHPRYVELHRIVTGLSTRTVWEALANDTFSELIDNVPDEFHPWVQKVHNELTSEFARIYALASLDLYYARKRAEIVAGEDYTRRDIAEQIKGQLYPGLVFGLLDRKDISPKIWAMLKPERSTAMILESGEE
jgi:RNA ligase